MSHTKCIVCFKNSAKIPLKYLQFCHHLFKKFWHGLSTELNQFQCGDYISLPFCSSYRVYLMKFANLNVKLESLAGDLCRLEEKHKVQLGKISSVQRQAAKNDNESQQLLKQISNIKEKDKNNFKVSLRRPMKWNEDTGTCDIEFGSGDCNAAESCSHGSQTAEQSQYDNRDQNVKLRTPVRTMKDQAVKTFEDKPARKWSRGKVEKISEKDFMFKDKFKFERTEFGFKCGTCSTSITFNKQKPVWSNMITHIQHWHLDSDRVRRQKASQRCIEIAPDRFQYGNYTFEKNENKWRCLICDYLAAIGHGKYKFKYISFHINYKHENPGRHHMCELCGTQFLSSMALKAHKITQHAQSNGSYPCGSCEKTFKTQRGAQNHENIIHKRRYHNFVCEICGKRYMSKIDVQAHISFVHNAQRTFQCKECGKAYSSRVALSRHKNHHTGKHTYACDICGMKFSQSYSVTKHKRTAHKN